MIGFLVVEDIFPLIGASAVYSNLGLFVLLYLIGASLKKYRLYIERVKKYRFAALLVLVCAALVCAVVVNVIGNNNLQKVIKILFGRFSILTTAIAVTVFIIVMYIEPFSNAVINTVSKSAFAVYLISENENIYEWFWKDCFNNSQIYNTYLFIPISLRDTLLVFSVCLIFDMALKNIILRLARLLIRK